jgi:hypothetical protein
MQSVSRLLVLVFAAALGVLPALRAGCDLNCDRRSARPTGQCSNHSELPPHAPLNGCGHDHSWTGMLTHGMDASTNRLVAVATLVTFAKLDQPLHQQVTLWTILSVLGAPPIAAPPLPLRI